MNPWPRAYLRDEAFALLRPLVSEDTGWLATPESLLQYLYGQVRRVSSRSFISQRLEKLAAFVEKRTPENELLHSWLERPFKALDQEQLTTLQNQIRHFVTTSVELSETRPWFEPKLTNPNGVSEGQLMRTLEKTLTEKSRQRILKRVTDGLDWQQKLKLYSESMSGRQEFENKLISDAVKKDPNLLAEEEKEQLDAAKHVFKRTADKIHLALGSEDICRVYDAPVILGKHYLNKQTQDLWMADEEFQKIVGTYARWDSAKIVLFREAYNYVREIERELKQYGWQMHGPWVPIHGKEKAQMSLIIDNEFPIDRFPIYEWSLNVEEITTEISRLQMAEAS